MKRRDFIALLRGAAAWPLAARAQQPAMSVVGYLNLGLAGARRDDAVAFQRGLNELGFVDGRNVLIEYRWANDQYERLPDFGSRPHPAPGHRDRRTERDSHDAGGESSDDDNSNRLQHVPRPSQDGISGEPQSARR